MPSTFSERSFRNFTATLAPLSDEARNAVNAAFEAMSTWRAETINSSEKSGALVIDKMAAAARALGWPEQIVDATRAQLQNITKMQIQTLDQMIDAWEEQIKSPNSPSGILSKIKSLSFGGTGSWSTADAATFNPFQAYMSFVEQWQKACTEAATSWLQLGRRSNVVEHVGLPRGMS